MIVKKVLEYLENNALYAKGIINAPVRKGKNIEYILYISSCSQGAKRNVEIINEVKNCITLSSLGKLE